MSDSLFAIALAIVLLGFLGVSLILLLRPSMFLRYSKNPLRPDTPGNRVQMRGVGLFFSLFTLMIISASLKTPKGFHQNILVALWVSPLVIPILLWILWRYSPLQQVMRRHLTGERIEDPAWELRMTFTFSGLLLFVVVTAFLLASMGYYPR
jgi:hypothetical protein